MPLPFSVSRDEIEPTIVTSRPSRIHTVPRPMTTRQWNRDQGRRSRRAGICVLMTPWMVLMGGYCPGRVSCNRRGVTLGRVLACRLLGHRPRFWSEGSTMRWECERCGQAAGSKEYESAQDATRYAL